MNTKASKKLFWLTISLLLTVVFAGGQTLTGFKSLWESSARATLGSGSQNTSLVTGDSNFPFKIEGSRFLKKSDDKPVFLNIIGYQPLEPSQNLSSQINENRIRDDLRRWRRYQGGRDPIVVRVYPQPTEDLPNRIPKVFYDGVRELGFWIIRDIYFEQNFCSGQDPNYTVKGYQAIDAVIEEVNDANAFDLIFAWEIGNEFQFKDTNCWDPAVIKNFVEVMCDHLKTKIEEHGINDSNWVTWASYPPYDPLYTDGSPLEPNCLDYISYNVYSYHPERVRDHQAGPVTGTPYQGYLAALKSRYPTKPLVISETGLSNSSQAVGQEGLHPWYPNYRYGGMSQKQAAEGLADRYWDARLLRDANEPNMVIAGIATFEWNDEWWKADEPNKQSIYPEEHFGLGRFEKITDNKYQLRYKLQQETIRDLYTLKFDNDANIIESVTATPNTLAVDSNTWVHVAISDAAARPVQLRWEVNRGYIIGDPNAVCDTNILGDPNSVKFYCGGRWLGPATITVIAIDANGNVDTASTCINIETSEPNRIGILTFGIGVNVRDPNVKASGRVSDVNLDEYKLVVYIKTNKFYAQPYQDTLDCKGMKSIWIGSDGYWWTKIFRGKDDPNYPGKLYCWLVKKDWPPPDTLELWQIPPHIAEANTENMDPCDYNDIDNDLLPDYWELVNFGCITAYDRYDDPDGDGANNLEEFLAGTSMVDGNDNDSDGDGLPDNWERHFFGDINLYDANDDPDGDGLTNRQEQEPNLGNGPDPNFGTHPGRASQDKDQNGLPDMWEIRWFGSLAQDANSNFDGDCFNNIEEYELGLDPTSRMGDLDRNCDVNFVDFRLFALHWCRSDCSEPNWCEWADINKNGDVNEMDLDLLSENWLRRLY
jgi:hypothetical protein